MSAIDPADVSLIVIAKAPLPGFAKTRLIPDARPRRRRRARRRRARRHPLGGRRGAGRPPGSRLDGAIDGAAWLPRVDGRRFEVIPQRGGGLGERLAGAFADSAATPALLVGMDTPQITPSLLEASVAALCRDGTDAVLGPASDGGWWAIGLREPQPGVFDGVPMSAGDTADRQRARLAELGLRVRELEQLRDIDTVEDARAVAAVNPWTRMAAALRELCLRRAEAPLAVLALLLLAGCGSADHNPPAAEPAVSPPSSARPAGELLRLGGEAEGVAIDPRTGLAAVSLRGPNRIELIDLDTGRTAKRIPTGDPARHLSLAAPGGPVLAPIEYRDELLEVELPSGRTSSVAVGDFPHDAAPSGARIFVSDEGGDTVSVVSGGGSEAELAVPEQPGGIAAANGAVAVVAVAAREVAFIDASSLRRIGTAPGGAGPSHVVAGPGGGRAGVDDRFYVVDTGGDAVLVYEGGDDPRLLDRANVPGSPYGIAVDERRGRIWVTQTALNRVVEMKVTDLAPKIIGELPDRAAAEQRRGGRRSGRVVVVGRDRGEVQIFDPGGGDGGMSRLEQLGDRVAEADEPRRPPSPPIPAAGPFRREFWRSPLRGRWLTSFLGSTLLPFVIVAALTGFLSHAAYDPGLGSNDVSGGFEVDLYFFDWPVAPAWLYSLTQSLHVLAGFAAIPILLAKLWSVIPKLFERPATRSVAHGLERLSLLTLVGSALFLFVSGVINVQYWLPFGFSFVPAHYYAALIFVAALAVHLVLKLPVVARTFRREGAFRPLGEGIERMRVADPARTTSPRPAPAAPTISRRGMLGAVAPRLGRPADDDRRLEPARIGPRDRAALAARPETTATARTTSRSTRPPRSPGSTRRGPADRGGSGSPAPAATSASAGPTCWRCRSTPSACRSPASRAGPPGRTGRASGSPTSRRSPGSTRRAAARCSSSRCRRGARSRRRRSRRNQIFDPRSLLALRVNGADLSPDHGYPARVIVPALPGVHNTKWVRRMTFTPDEGTVPIRVRRRAAASDRRRGEPAALRLRAASDHRDPRRRPGPDLARRGGAAPRPRRAAPLQRPLPPHPRRRRAGDPRPRGDADGPQPRPRPDGALPAPPRRLCAADPAPRSGALHGHDRPRRRRLPRPLAADQRRAVPDLGDRLRGPPAPGAARVRGAQPAAGPSGASAARAAPAACSSSRSAASSPPG